MRFYSLILLGIAVPALTFATPLFDATLTPVPTAVSGKLQPLVLAVDGKTVRKEKAPATGLWVNGTAVTPKKEKGSPFYHRMEGDRLGVRVKLKNGGSRNWNMTLPSAA